MLRHGTVGFRPPLYFNDPFEIEAAYPKSQQKSHFHNMLENTRTNAKKDIAARSAGVLSLTRQPLNPLMWAHYGDKHSGLVIGIDCSVPEFTCENTNLIPIQYGNVIYTSTMPKNNFLSSSNNPFKVGRTYNFAKEHLERLQRMYLYKPSYWSYEEEVRLVKCLHGIEDNNQIPSGKFKTIRDENSNPLYLFTLPKGAIKEVYFGARTQCQIPQEVLELCAEIHEYQPGIKIFGCSIGNSNWDLESFDFEAHANEIISMVSNINPEYF